MKIFFSLVFVLFLLAGFGHAEACSVMAGYPGTPQENYDRSDVVFVGRVTSVLQDKSVYGDYRIKFEISKAYKGNLGTTVTIMAAGSSAACGYDDGKGVFKTGSVWAIYADSEFRTSSVVANKQYASVDEARAELDALERPTACPMNYAPVCGRRDTGIRCVTTPCDSSEDKTYGNMCMLGVDKAEFLYDGECRAAVSPKPVPPTVQQPPQPEPQDDPGVFPTTPPGAGEEAVVTAWQRFWTGLKQVIFFWR